MPVFGVAVVVLASILFALPSDAAAQGPAAAAQPTMGTVTLQPGANEFGWIAEAVDPRVLFDEIAELESIWAWHAPDRRWQAAARDVPLSLWTLYRLRPGMGLHFQIAGDVPVQWERSLVPGGGKVELQPGDNFVAWAGRDGWDVNQFAKGIGRQLQEIRRRNTETGELEAIWPVAEGAEAATVARGEALWVKMPRSIVWLQPTDVMPRLVFPGGAPGNLQAAVHRDLRNTLDYFAAEYGIQADFAGFSIYLPADGESLKRQLILDGRTVDDADVDRILNSAGVHGSYGVVIRRHEEAGALADISYQRILTHEYFHRIQDDLENGGDGQAEWVVEGSANYVEWDQQVAGGERTWAEIAADLQELMYDDVPRLASAEQENRSWEYYLGPVALRRLVERSGPDAWIDFYREIAPTRIGPIGRWQSILSWRDVFALAFGVEIDEFYAAFDQWQADLAARNGRRPGDRAMEEYARIEGRVVRADGSPVGGRFVSANEIAVGSDGEHRSVGKQQRAETDADGNFSVIAPKDGRYMLRIDLDDGQRCGLYYSKAGGMYGRDDADLLTAGSRTLRGIRFVVAADACVHELRGTVRGPDGGPLAGIWLYAHLDDDVRVGLSTRTSADGGFTSAVPRDGNYRIWIALSEGCQVPPAIDGAILDAGDASLVQISREDVHVDIRVPQGACRNTINGRLLDMSGEPIAGAYMELRDGALSSWGRTDSAGAFSILVPQDGSYHIHIMLSEACEVYFADGGVAKHSDGASRVRIAGADVRIDVRVPDGVCGYALSGRLLDASGGPMAGVQVRMGETADALEFWASRTDGTGAFSGTVPRAGNYRLRITLAEGCHVYYGDGGVAVEYDLASLVRVAEADIHVDVHVPEGVCENAISGQLLNASGEPLAGAVVQIVHTETGAATYIRTNADGDFTLIVPQDGSYRIRIDLAESCRFYFSGESLTPDRDATTLVQVRGGDVRVGDIRVPAGICDG